MDGIIYIGERWSVVGSEKNPAFSILIHEPEKIKEFKGMVARALNSWDDAPIWLKEFGDVIEYGKPMQNYAMLRQKQTPPGRSDFSISPYAPGEELPICAKCGQKGKGHMFSCEELTKKDDKTKAEKPKSE